MADHSERMAVSGQWKGAVLEAKLSDELSHCIPDPAMESSGSGEVDLTVSQLYCLANSIAGNDGPAQYKSVPTHEEENTGSMERTVPQFSDSRCVLTDDPRDETSEESVMMVSKLFGKTMKTEDPSIRDPLVGQNTAVTDTAEVMKVPNGGKEIEEDLMCNKFENHSSDCCSLQETNVMEEVADLVESDCEGNTLEPDSSSELNGLRVPELESRIDVLPKHCDSLEAVRASGLHDSHCASERHKPSLTNCCESKCSSEDAMVPSKDMSGGTSDCVMNSVTDQWKADNSGSGFTSNDRCNRGDERSQECDCQVSGAGDALFVASHPKSSCNDDNHITNNDNKLTNNCSCGDTTATKTMVNQPDVATHGLETSSGESDTKRCHLSQEKGSSGSVLDKEICSAVYELDKEISKVLEKCEYLLQGPSKVTPSQADEPTSVSNNSIASSQCSSVHGINRIAVSTSVHSTVTRASNTKAESSIENSSQSVSAQAMGNTDSAKLENVQDCSTSLLQEVGLNYDGIDLETVSSGKDYHCSKGSVLPSNVLAEIDATCGSAKSSWQSNQAADEKSHEIYRLCKHEHFGPVQGKQKSEKAVCDQDATKMDVLEALAGDTQETRFDASERSDPSKGKSNPEHHSEEGSAVRRDILRSPKLRSPKMSPLLRDRRFRHGALGSADSGSGSDAESVDSQKGSEDSEDDDEDAGRQTECSIGPIHTGRRTPGKTQIYASKCESQDAKSRHLTQICLQITCGSCVNGALEIRGPHSSR